jgi:hypothetical protein
MAYHIEIDEALVLNYLCDPDRGLDEADVDTLLRFLEGLSDTGEAYHNDPPVAFSRAPHTSRWDSSSKLPPAG